MPRRPRAQICIGCGGSYVTNHGPSQSYCSRACADRFRKPGPGRTRGDVEIDREVKTYPGLTRYIVRWLEGGFVVWDTQTDTVASAMLDFAAAFDRSFELERSYGTLVKAAA